MAETQTNGLEVLETREWLDSLDYVLSKGGPERAGRLLQQLALHARRAAGVNLPFTATTPYQNTIPSRQQPPFPGSQEMERRIKSLVRWNALAMVVRANKKAGTASADTSRPSPRPPLCMKSGSITSCRHGPKPAIATSSTSRDTPRPASMPALFWKAAFRNEKLENFRRELKPGGGLSSYPHPWLMPDFWEFPTVSMGLGPIQAIYQARFIRYLEDRGLEDTHRRQGLGVPGRRRNGRARIAGRHHPGLARTARQPDLCHQLQLAAAGWTGARQRQDHSGTGSHLPRRRLERHQGDLGQRLGHPDPATIATACWSSAWARSRTASIRNIPSRAAHISARTSSAPIPGC